MDALAYSRRIYLLQEGRLGKVTTLQTDLQAATQHWACSEFAVNAALTPTSP